MGCRTPNFSPDSNGTWIRINVLRINDLRSTLTSIRVIELYINNTEYASETQGLPSSEIEIMLLIIGRRAGVFVRNTLRPSVLGLTECHSWLSPFLSPCHSPTRPLSLFERTGQSTTGSRRCLSLAVGRVVFARANLAAPVCSGQLGVCPSIRFCAT